MSLCSCYNESELTPEQIRPLYEYSLDRQKLRHTYTCEQNAQILLRLKRDRLKNLKDLPPINKSVS